MADELLHLRMQSLKTPEMTPQEWLLHAAERWLKVYDAQQKGTYYGPSEDLQAIRDLTAAVAAVKEERHQQELMDRR